MWKPIFCKGLSLFNVFGSPLPRLDENYYECDDHNQDDGYGNELDCGSDDSHGDSLSCAKM